MKEENQIQQEEKADTTDLNQTESVEQASPQIIEQNDSNEKKDFIADPSTKTVDISKRQKKFKTIVTIVFVAFIVGVLVFTAYKDFFGNEGPGVPIEVIFATLLQNWYYLIFALIALALCYFFKGLKLSLMCKQLTGKMRFKTCMQTGTIGHYYNCVTPLAVGGQPFEIYNLSKHGVESGVASSLPIATFFLNQFAFVLLAIVSLILYSFNALGMDAAFASALPPAFFPLAIIGIVCCLAMPLLVVIFCMLPRLGSKIVHLAMLIGGKLKILKNPALTEFKTMKTIISNSKCLKKVATSPFYFLLYLLVGICEWLALGSIAYFSLRFFGFDMPAVGGLLEWVQILHLCFVLYASISFVPTPGNSGAADLSFFLLFSVGFSGAGIAFPAMMTWRLLSFYSFIIIGFIYTNAKKHKEKVLLKKSKQ